MPAPSPAQLGRRALLSGIGAMATLACQRRMPSEPEGKRMEAKHDAPTGRLPVLFIGHGSPMNAIEDNQWSRAFKQLGEQLPKPRAILCVSAHWYVPGTHVTGNEHPETIHDFGGFPEALQRMQYPAAGDVALAKRVTELVPAAQLSTEWGLDHGTWTVLHYLRPAADCPVIQLSIDERAREEQHVALGRALAPLRDEGVLILGSGNIVHNLRDAFGRMRRGDSTTPDWARSFDADAEKALSQHDRPFLAGALQRSYGRDAHPSPDHYLPLLYCAGAASDSDRVSFPITGFDAGSLSMRAVRYDA
jgi:4,5-DOPA dioxygenase extradiol